MKTIKNILSIIALLSFFTACSDTWDSHYAEQDPVIENDNVQLVSASTVGYITSEASLSTMNSLFDKSKVIDQIKAQDQVTLLVVENNNIDNSTNLEDIYLAQTHMSDLSISPANLLDGERVLMHNGKYLTIRTEEGANKAITYYFNNARVNKIIKTTDGYVYVLNAFVEAPRSLYEMIETLDEDYSIFREMVLSRNEKVFDKQSSVPIGVDNTGSTIYDSVFTMTNPYFDAKGFNLTSEALTATLLIPSNAVVEEAISTAKKSLGNWGLARADSIIENWVFQSAFFDQQYTKADFAANVDLKSIFDKQWRTTVQKVDLDNPVELSNGMAYYVQWMKIPTNVLIFRLKDYFKWYEFLTVEDKDKYYQTENLLFNKCNTDVAAWSPVPGLWPDVENRILIFKLEDKTLPARYKLGFTLFKYDSDGSGSYEAEPYIIPPGEYELCMGFKQLTSKNSNINIYFNNKLVRLVSETEFTSTTFHYDRGGQGYPEGYDPSKNTHSKKSNYGRDGGKIGNVVVEGEAKEVLLTFDGTFPTRPATDADPNPQAPDMNFHHWCLKPTANCY